MNKNKWIILVVGIAMIVMLSVFSMQQIHANHQTNLVKSEDCMENGGTVMVEEKGFFSLATVYCKES